MASLPFQDIAKNNATFLQQFKNVWDSPKQFELLLNLSQTEVGTQTLCEYTWSTWKYVTQENEVAVASLYHYFNGIVKAQMTAFNKYEEGKNDDMDTKGCLDSNKQHNGKLIIHAAVYGLADVTNIVRDRINQKNQSLSIQAINSIFGDPWSGIYKSLIIVWGFEGSEYIQTSIANEGATIDIDKSGFVSKFKPNNESNKLNILSAVYGLKDHSEFVQSMVTKGNLNFVANNGVFGDSWIGIQKSMVVVYRIGVENPENALDNIKIKIVKENQRLAV